MKFIETAFEGAYVVEMEKIEDSRGYFSRTWCKKEAESVGILTEWVQLSTSYNIYKNTIRGLHFQLPPHEEVKLVRCTQGALFDVIVDLREDSPTYKKWFGIELSDSNGKMLYIPAGFAHGYQTLEPGTEIFYQMSSFYAPQFYRGYRYDDPTFKIEWKDFGSPIVSRDDLNWEPFPGGAQ